MAPFGMRSIIGFAIDQGLRETGSNRNDWLAGQACKDTKSATAVLKFCFDMFVTSTA